MGTRSTIALEYADGTIGQIYCHWDGYLEHNGEILRNFYKDPFKVRDLLNGGDTSTLSETVEGCDFYTNRGEELNPQRMYKDIAEYFAECQQEEYDYILRNIDGQAVWFVRSYYTNDQWITLEQAFIEQKVSEEN